MRREGGSWVDVVGRSRRRGEAEGTLTARKQCSRQARQGSGTGGSMECPWRGDGWVGSEGGEVLNHRTSLLFFRA